MVNNQQYTEEEDKALESMRALLIDFLDKHERVRWGNVTALVCSALNTLDAGQMYMTGLDLPIHLKERTTGLFNGLRAHGMR